MKTKFSLTTIFFQVMIFWFFSLCNTDSIWFTTSTYKANYTDDLLTKFVIFSYSDLELCT